MYEAQLDINKEMKNSFKHLFFHVTILYSIQNI